MKERTNLIVKWALPAMLVLGLCFSSNLRAQTEKELVAIPAPPMGWSSWNSFSNIVDSKIVMDQARRHDFFGNAQGWISIHQH